MSSNIASVIVALENIKEELKRHHERLDSIDCKLDNHITTIEHRLTKIESYQKSQRWIIGFLFAGVISIAGMMFVNMVS